MVILGGASTLVGPVIGAAVVVFIKNYLSLYIQRWPTVMGLIFIVTILFARHGIVGAVRPWLARRTGGRRGRPTPEVSGLEYVGAGETGSVPEQVTPGGRAS
jgi:branched-chain amino acid transport system permease protein